MTHVSNPPVRSGFRTRAWLAGGALVGLSALGAALMLPSGQASAVATASAPPAIPVSVAVVKPSEVSAWDEFSGRLEAVERVDLRPRVPGTVLAVHFREGALVKKGELLVSIDPAPYAAEVERAEAQVVAAQARVAYSRSEHERARRLWDDQAIAQRELDERQNSRLEAEANLRSAQAALQSARLNLDYTQVRAPVSGRVGRLELTVGNQVAAGPDAPLLATLVSVSPIYASFDADERVLAKAIHERSRLERIPVQMGTLGQEGTPLQGRLQLIDNQVNARSGTVRLRAVFDNPDGSLMPGQFARLRLGQAETQRALLVNERAVGTDQNKRFVMVVGAGNQAEYREVQLGAASGGLRIVTRGLQANERIVVNGLQRVRPGALLAPSEVPMAAKPEIQANNKTPAPAADKG